MSDSIQDSTRYVVSKLHYGAILPGKRMEMNRDVFLVKGADIRGGVWANNMDVAGGPIHVEQSVYCRGAMKIRGEGDEKLTGFPVQFDSCVVANDSLVIAPGAYPSRFASDIFTGNLNLHHSVVLGNIYARNVYLDHTIVLGGIFCEGNLDIRNSMLATFRVKQCRIGRNTYLFFPFAVSEEPMAMEDKVRALTFFNLTHRAEKEGKEPGGILYLDEGDIHQVVTKDDSDLQVESGYDQLELKPLHVLSGNERILDNSTVSRYFQHNRELLERLALGSHLQKDGASTYEGGEIELLQEKLWALLDRNDELESLDGKTPWARYY